MTSRTPEEVQELDPLETVLNAADGKSEGDAVPVRLHAHVTEVGTLELWCESRGTPHRWRLQFELRDEEAEALLLEELEGRGHGAKR